MDSVTDDQPPTAQPAPKPYSDQFDFTITFDGNDLVFYVNQLSTEGDGDVNLYYAYGTSEPHLLYSGPTDDVRNAMNLFTVGFAYALEVSKP